MREFKFRARPELFGSEFSTLGVQVIEGNIWKAGGETNGMTLGISFETKDRILLNTLHFADAQRESQSTLTSGLRIISSPWIGESE